MASLSIKLLVLLLNSHTVLGGGIPYIEFNFQGVASGGTLTIGNTLNRNAFCASIETDSGEPVKSVIEKLAVAVVYNSYLFEKPDNITAEQMVQEIISGDVFKLIGLPGMYFITGTETGLGIPGSPRFLSCNYDSVNEQLKIRWDNCSEVFDNIALILKWNKYDSDKSIILPGSMSQYVIARDKVHYSVDDLDIWVIGIKDGLPSSPTTITLSDNGTVQQELHGIPFKSGILPNWKPWDISMIRYANYECLVKEELVSGKQSRFITTNSEKPYVQILRTPNGGGSLGVYRRFLGLTPGHTYRLTARLNTLDMDRNQADWSFSLHMAHNGSNGEDFSAHQFAGTKALPDGKVGSKAGLVAEYGAAATTKRKYVAHTGDITLPDGVNSVTVWLRHSSSKATTGVALDWLQLKDVTAANSR